MVVFGTTRNQEDEAGQSPLASCAIFRRRSAVRRRMGRGQKRLATNQPIYERMECIKYFEKRSPRAQRWPLPTRMPRRYKIYVGICVSLVSSEQVRVPRHQPSSASRVSSVVPAGVEEVPEAGFRTVR